MRIIDFPTITVDGQTFYVNTDNGAIFDMDGAEIFCAMCPMSMEAIRRVLVYGSRQYNAGVEVGAAR